MSQDPEKFLFFKVGLLKDSAALDALWQDALKHHMVDQPDKLIALRLTEYYELVSQGILHPVAQVSRSAATPAQIAGESRERTTLSRTPTPPTSNGAKQVTSPRHKSQPATESRMHQAQATSTSVVNDYGLADDNALAMIPNAEQNAEDAADYWSLL